MAKCRTAANVRADLRQRNGHRIADAVADLFESPQSRLKLADLDDRNFALAIELMIRSRRDRCEDNCDLDNPNVLDYLTRCDDAADAIHEQLYK